MNNYKLSLTAGEIEKKLSMCTLPMVEIEVPVYREPFTLSEEKSAELDEVFATGLPCVIAVSVANGARRWAETHVASRGADADGISEYTIVHGEQWLRKNSADAKWEYQIGGE